jgi:hypothetical protein
MSKRFPDLSIAITAVFALAVPVAAQTNPEASQQRSTESVPVCVPTTTTTLETTTPRPTLTVYNPAMAFTAALTFYNPSAFPAPPLTFYTPLGQIDPPLRTPRPLSPPPGQTMQSAPAMPSQPLMPTTQTIPSPGPCPPGTQVERLAR